jgi:hypothetical protein
MKGKEDEVKHRSELGDSAEAEDNKAGSEDCPSYHTNSKCRSDQAHLSDSSADISFPATVGVQEVSGADDNMSLFVCLKKEHDLAKAVKSDDAEVPVFLWDNAVCGDKTSTQRQV